MTGRSGRPQPGRWGVQQEYVDATGVRRRVSSRAVHLALEAMGADAPSPPAGSAPVFARAGEPLPRGVVRIVLEDGAELDAGRRSTPAAGRGPVTLSRLPRATPPGYHRVVLRDGSERLLVTSPGRCHLPDLHGWGWAAQLYAARSAASWGIGDLSDLRGLRDWSRRGGAAALLINPLHAPPATLPQEPSPYFPSSRRFRSPLYIAVDEVPGAGDHSDVAAVAGEARRLNEHGVIERDRVYALKMHALARLWERFSGDRRFDAYCAREGDALLRYACFCVLSDRYPEPWASWPEQYRRPDSAAVRRIADGERGRVDFHRWLQWLLDLQLDAAGGRGNAAGDGAGTAIVHDVAIGFAPDGADAWEWQDELACGMRIGAPPDEFMLSGQDWGLPPFDPHRLRASGYAPLRQTLRAVMRRGHGVRIDHVMGLFRLWWVPANGGAAAGVYVRYPARELLDIVALESTRAGAFVVGEDLGTVEQGVRAELRRRRMLSYRIAWFEDRAPERYPAQSVAALSTHDLPTVAGVWTGADTRELEQCGIEVNRPAEERVRRRLQRLAGVGDDARPDDVIIGAYQALARAPSMLLLATLDDATASPRRPNIPGAMSRPNWSLPLTRTLEQLRRDRLPRRIAAALGGRA